MNRDLAPYIKSTASILQSFSAAWFGLAFITPKFIELQTQDAIYVLTMYIFFGMVFLILSAKCLRIIDIYYV